MEQSNPGIRFDSPTTTYVYVLGRILVDCAIVPLGLIKANFSRDHKKSKYRTQCSVAQTLDLMEQNECKLLQSVSTN